MGLAVTKGREFDNSAGSTWRFMGSYKWGHKSPNMGYNMYIVALPITLLITTHEPPSIGTGT